MKLPQVSVIMAAFNHDQFVAESIHSVLKQEEIDLEFLIADDGSSDNTCEVVESFRDKRIKFLPNKNNRGACIVTNELIARSRAKYIALINSDDIWLNDKLRHQLNILDKLPKVGACFSRAGFIDKDGVPIIKKSLPYGSIFEQQNKSGAQWLRQFFDSGNCICHPTMLIRRSCYEQLGPYNNRFRQLPDFDMWIRLVKQFEIYISDRELVQFRILPGGNVSSPTSENSIRTINEHYLIASTFFNDVTRKQLVDGFHDLIISKDIPSQEHLDIEKVLLYFAPNQWLGKPYKLIGLLELNSLLSSPVHAEILVNSYGIDDRWFHKKMGDIDVLRPKMLAAASHSKSVMRNAWRNFNSRLFRNSTLAG